MLTTEELQAVKAIADANSGKCDRCHRQINIYRYTLNKQMVIVLKQMLRVVEETKLNRVNFDELHIAYRLLSQRTKMRLHGLIAKYKESGIPVKNTWLITTKGFNFLRGAEVPATVVVFDNQLLGHEGVISIGKITKEASDSFSKSPITPSEADQYSQPVSPQTIEAKYIGSRYGNKLNVGEVYKLAISKLKFGSPVIITMPKPLSYKDIAEFQREWQIIRSTQ